jgi:hypothetical protein
MMKSEFLQMFYGDLHQKKWGLWPNFKQGTSEYKQRKASFSALAVTISLRKFGNVNTSSDELCAQITCRDKNGALRKGNLHI